MGHAPPAGGFLTFVNPERVERKRQPGLCFLRAGFEPMRTTAGGHGRSPLLLLRLRPEAFGPSWPATREQADLFG